MYKPGPGLHLDVLYKIRPVFKDLSEDNELERCLHGKTQNANESFNGTIWERIPKRKYVSPSSLEVGVYDAVRNFNITENFSRVKMTQMLESFYSVYTDTDVRVIFTLVGES